MCSFHRNRGGFTLVELLIVIALITVLVAFAAPKLLPAIAVARLEGAARHATNYGRAAIAHAALYQEQLTVKIDLDKQQYWTERWVDASEALFDLDEEPEEDREELGAAFGGTLEEEEEAVLKAEQTLERFERLARLRIEMRVKNLDKGGLFDDFEPLFEERFTLHDDETDEEAEEVKVSLLQRTKLGDGVEIESVQVGSKTHANGTVEVEITPIGLAETVVFYLKGSAGDYYTVAWDPITGGARLYEGKERL